jgi:hypothetical protein
MAANPWAPWLGSWGTSSEWNQPLSGDVSQLLRIFSPTVTVNGRGDPELEGEIVRDVATYGAQLAPLIDLVLAQADGKAPPKEALEKLRAICLDVEAKKVAYRKGALDRARAALNELKEHDRPALAGLLTEFGADAHTRQS